ncbi:MAG: LPP20 family lipoprotein [Candidatus Sericytochromatia bacterium]
MKKSLHILLSSALLLSAGSFVCLPQATQAQNTAVMQNMGNGSIDWTHQMLKVTGSGAPPANGSAAQKRLMAKRAAQADAYRQLAEIVNGVQVDSETVVKDFVTESDTVRLRVSALIKATPAGPERYLSDGSVEVDLAMSMNGQQGLSSAIELEKTLKKQQERFNQQGFWPGAETPAHPVLIPGQQYALAPWNLAAKPKVKPTPKPVVKPTPKPVKPASGYTGLIIDASGLDIQPAMSPMVLSESEQVYIGNFELDIDRVIAEGIIVYHRNMKDIRRAGSNPLVVRATGTSEGRVDLMVSPEDAAKIQAEDAKNQFLSKLNVAVVM